MSYSPAVFTRRDTWASFSQIPPGSLVIGRFPPPPGLSPSITQPAPGAAPPQLALSGGAKHIAIIKGARLAEGGGVEVECYLTTTLGGGESDLHRPEPGRASPCRTACSPSPPPTPPHPSRTHPAPGSSKLPSSTQLAAVIPLHRQIQIRSSTMRWLLVELQRIVFALTDEVWVLPLSLFGLPQHLIIPTVGMLAIERAVVVARNAFADEDSDSERRPAPAQLPPPAPAPHPPHPPPPNQPPQSSTKTRPTLSGAWAKPLIPQRTPAERSYGTATPQQPQAPVAEEDDPGWMDFGDFWKCRSGGGVTVWRSKPREEGKGEEEEEEDVEADEDEFFATFAPGPGPRPGWISGSERWREGGVAGLRRESRLRRPMALDVGVFPSLVTFLGRESARSLHNLP